VARQGDAMIYDDEMDLLLGSRVRQAEPREHPSAMFVQLLQQRAAYGHRAASTRLDFRTGTLVRDDNKKFFRQIYAIETMDNMAADLRNVLGQRRTMLEELLRRQAHAGVEFNLCQRAIDNVTRVLSMMRRFFEKMHSKYQRVLAHGISFAERKKRSARFFQYVNLVFYLQVHAGSRAAYRGVLLRLVGADVGARGERGAHVLRGAATVRGQQRGSTGGAAACDVGGRRRRGHLVRHGNGGRVAVDTATVGDPDAAQRASASSARRPPASRAQAGSEQAHAARR
jgi:hypothetical protein